MKNIFEFLFYCLYRVFKLLKRVGEKEENLASSFYAILLSTNSVLLLLPFRFIIPASINKIHYVKYYIFLMCALIIIGWLYYCNQYFIRQMNYQRIINNEFSKQLNQTKFAIYGIAYSLLTFISYISITSLLSN